MKFITFFNPAIFIEQDLQHSQLQNYSLKYIFFKKEYHIRLPNIKRLLSTSLLI